jgi:hypothetical protein
MREPRNLYHRSQSGDSGRPCLIPFSSLPRLFGGFFIVLAWLGLAIWSLIVAIRSLWNRRWLLSFICLIMPGATPFITIQAIPYAQYPGDYAYFLAMRSKYDAAVARLPKNGHWFATSIGAACFLPPRASFTMRRMRSATLRASIGSMEKAHEGH